MSEVYSVKRKIPLKGRILHADEQDCSAIGLSRNTLIYLVALLN
jgi:hypothetical protein